MNEPIVLDVVARLTAFIQTVPSTLAAMMVAAAVLGAFFRSRLTVSLGLDSASDKDPGFAESTSRSAAQTQPACDPPLAA